MRPGRLQLLGVLLLVLATLPAEAQPRDRDAAGRARAERAAAEAPPSFRAWVEGLPAEQRRPLVRRLRRMPERRREHLFRRWDHADEAERERFKRFLEERTRGSRSEASRPRTPMRRFEQLPPASRERIAPLLERWRGMEPSERRRMRHRLERFRTLSDEQQEALIERRFGSRSAEERARILESLREASRALPSP